MADIIEKSRTRWPGILSHFGFEDRYLKNRHGPCPLCGGTDRYRFDDRYGDGNYYCHQCDPGNGMDLLMKKYGWDFITAAEEVEKVLGVCPVSETKTEEKDVEKIKSSISRIWKQATDDAVLISYLQSRGLKATSTALKGCRVLNYRDKSTGEIIQRPAMVALVKNTKGKVITLHRTFILPNGQREKRLYEVIPETWIGGAIRLFPVAEEIGFISLAEGIESALAVHELFEVPTWATVTAQGMAEWEPPEGVRRVSIFGDCDDNFVGQNAAYALARRLSKRGIIVEVHIPKKGDWLDFYLGRKQQVA